GGGPPGRVPPRRARRPRLPPELGGGAPLAPPDRAQRRDRRRPQAQAGPPRVVGGRAPRGGRRRARPRRARRGRARRVLRRGQEGARRAPRGAAEGARPRLLRRVDPERDRVEARDPARHGEDVGPERAHVAPRSARPVPGRREDRVSEPEHEERALAEAYALGALDATEKKLFEAHLASCRACRDAVGTAALAANAVALSAP